MSSALTTRAFACLLALLACAAGCGSSSASAFAPGDAALPHAIDEQIVSVRVGKANLGSAASCDPEFRTVLYDRASRRMSWPACALPSTGPSSDAGTPYPAVERALGDAEVARVEAALAAITYEEHPVCEGLYDGREWFMETKTAGGVVVQYSATNVNCYGYRLASGLVQLYDLFTELRG